MAKNRPTAWVGWIYFASAMLLVAGGIQVIAGLTGIFNADFYTVSQTGNIVAFNYTTWGWIHLIIGIIGVAAGFALAVGRLWAQVLALVVTIIAAITNLAFIGVYPLWSIAALVVNGLVIYAITLHGDEVRE